MGENLEEIELAEDPQKHPGTESSDDTVHTPPAKMEEGFQKPTSPSAAGQVWQPETISVRACVWRVP